MTDAARSIALALFRETREHGEIEAVTSDLAQLARLASSHEVRRFLYHPRIPLEDKERILAPSVGNELVRRVLSILLYTRATGLIAAVNAAFVRLVRRERGFVETVARVAQPLTPAQEEEIRTAVAAATGLTPVMKVQVDPQLIGGVRLTIDGRVADNSLKSRLERLKESLEAL
ncbi:MAG TPA: ATP synthase F1 subunit delta [bacterium]|nr:ATP synthase F1 subunit delta [bacterium]